MLLQGESVIAGEMGRLFFRCFSATGVPFTTLTPSKVTGNVQRRHVQAAGGNWLSADHLGIPWPELTLSIQTDPLDPGRFIQWLDCTGKKNLYSIDVAHTHITNQWDTDAVRLNLVGVNLLFQPCVHPVAPVTTLKLEDIKQQLDELKDVNLTEMRYLIDQIFNKVYQLQ
jgi:hypothetical protein